MRMPIHLETQSDVMRFVNVVNNVPDPVYVTDGHHCRVSAKSLLGVLYSLEFTEIWCECEKDIYHLIFPFVAH